MSWMYRVQDQEFGPVSAAELKQLAKAGTIAPTDHVRPETLAKWSLASNVKGLFPEVVELVLDDPISSSEPVNAPPSLPPPLPVSEPPGTSTAQRSSNEPPAAKGELFSHSALALKAQVSEAVWKKLVQLQLPIDDELFWTRLSAFRSRRKEVQPKDAEAKNFWQRASEKISSLAESAEIQTNRYLVLSTDNRFWVTNQLAAVGEAWNLPADLYQLSCTWSVYELIVNLETTSQDAEVELAQFKIDLSRDNASRCYGSPNRIISLADAGPKDIPADRWTSYPVVCQKQLAQLGSFFYRKESPGRIGLAALMDSAIDFGNQTQVLSLAFENILGWRKGNGWLSCLHDTGKQLQFVSIVTAGATSPTDDLKTFIASMDDAKAAAGNALEGVPSEAVPDNLPEAAVRAIGPPETQPTAEAVERRAHPRRALDSILGSLSRACPDKFCQTQLLAAEFSATPLFGTPRKRLAMVCRDNDVQIITAEPGDSRWAPLTSARLHKVHERWFVEASGGEAFELQVDGDNEPIVVALAASLQSISPGATEDSVLVLLAPSTDQTLDWGQSRVFRLRFEADGTLRFEAPDDTQPDGTFSCAADAVSKKSRLWSDQYGIADVAVPGSDAQMQFLAPRESLVRIWETRELTNFRKKTHGISLGEMYTQYNEMRTRKFVTGIFGNYFLAQQQLELRSPLDNFIAEIESFPSEALSPELEEALIERLSILEISRNQLNRWLDRCTLMYPHQQADLTRRWLEEAFGDEVISREDRDKEAWRVHHQTRADLRQVQASMNRAMAEVGQNLNTISFVFPEEVRCAALAATRRAASMAGTGAMVTAFAGMGGQMLMGLNRLSQGDPLGVAMLGSVGLSLAGRQLEKSAQDTEKKLRVRAYGVQALQWWKVVLETASIMALESRHTMEQTQKAAMMRDRKLLESMPREKLPQAQKRMASVMRDMLHEEVGNQFYEAIPGSGVFGWHIVDHMSEMTVTQPKAVLKNFSGEVPGSLAIGVNDV